MKKIFLIIFLSALLSEITGQEFWTKYGNPVLQPGVEGSWDHSAIFVPSVLLYGSNYRMWYGGFDGVNFRIGYAFSTDGISWEKDTLNNPILDVGNPGEWDDIFVYTPSVVFDGSIYHMWYTGHDGLDNERIGHATSPDGIAWTKDILNPVVTTGPPGSWDDQIVAGGYVFLDGSTFHMWYAGTNGIVWGIGHATSTDGSTWSKDPSNPVLQDGSPTQWDYPMLQPGSVIYEPYNSLYYLFYGGGHFMEWKIGYATSPDINGPWTKNITNPILSPTPAGWDSLFVSAPNVIYDQISGDYKMWYTGGNASFTGIIGLATKSPPLPVELTSFTATSQAGKVTLSWTTATEINNLGFEIERRITNKEDQSEWTLIGFREGNGTTTEPKEYLYTDNISGITAASIVYRLKQIDYNGTYEYSNEVYVDSPAPADYALLQNYPNPFNPQTTIQLELPTDGFVSLKIYNVLGQEVATLVSDNLSAGSYKYVWNASNFASGIYVYRLEANGIVLDKKMILMK